MHVAIQVCISPRPTPPPPSQHSHIYNYVLMKDRNCGKGKLYSGCRSIKKIEFMFSKLIKYKNSSNTILQFAFFYK